MVLLYWDVGQIILERQQRERCYVVIELKVVPFEPAFVGTINVYLSAVDDLLRHADDRPTIGLLLCRSKDKIVVEYALRDLNKPIGVAEWESRAGARTWTETAHRREATPRAVARADATASDAVTETR
jgi:hypothetical protein